MPLPPPVLDLRWFETKLYPVILTSSAVLSVSHVSEIPITENGLALNSMGQDFLASYQHLSV